VTGLRYPDDLQNMLANYEGRLKELERRLPAINDDPPPSGGCCDTGCANQSGFVDLAVGQSSTILTITWPRPAAGRIVITGGLTAELDQGNGDFHVRSQISVSGTRYHPIRFYRDQVSLDGDRCSLSPRVVFDFQAGAALTVGLYVVNLSNQHIIVSEGTLDVLARGRGGSTRCDPVSSGTG
jgi:hypothetical protein